MTRTRFAAGSLAGMVLLVLVNLSADGANGSGLWITNYDQAVAMSKQTGRPMLLHFYATWCGPCKQMEKDIFDKRDVQAFLSANFIPVKVDCSHPNQLAENFNVQMLPTELVISPNGETLLKFEGFDKNVNRQAYLARLQGVVDQFPAQAQVQVQEPEREQPKPPEQKLKTDTKVPESKLLVGLDRYSPVSLAKGRQWRKGKQEFALVYQGVVYLMFDKSEYDEFQSEPSKFAPKLLGCDPVVLWTSDKAVAGSTQYGAFFDDNLYLFQSAENRDRFKKEPMLFSRPQHVLKANEIVDGSLWR